MKALHIPPILVLMLVSVAYATDIPCTADLPEIKSERILFTLDSGRHSASSGQLERKYEQIIHLSDAAWLRLHFDDYNLGDRSYLIIHSLKDDGWQKLTAESIMHWNGSTAFFNGDRLHIELFVDGAEKNEIFFSVGEVSLGGSSKESASEEIKNNDHPGIQSLQCNPPNTISGCPYERISSNYPSVSRTIIGSSQGGQPYVSATAFMVANGGHVTAGHAIRRVDNGSYYNVILVEYNVPESGPDGTPIFSHPDNQYPVDQSSLLGNNMKIGDDWGVFRTFPNSNTGLTAAQGQDSFFRLDSNPGLLNGDPIITAGYGRDDDPNGTGPPIPPGPACNITDPGLGWCHNNMSTTQQKSVGIHLSTFSDNHTARSEIAAGVSGGPMIAFDSGLVYGIVTHRLGGTCTKSCFNFGQNLSVTSVYNAINNLVGINAQFVDPDHPKFGGDGSIFQPHANIQDAIDAATSGGYIILMPGTHAVSGIDLKNKNLTFFSPFKETTVLIHGGNLEISSNRTLRFEGSTIYRFQPGRRINNYGNLEIDGSESNKITFTAENDNSSWGGVTFNHNSGGIVQNAIIERVSGFGNSAVSIQGNASPVIQYSSIKTLPGAYTFGISAQSGIGYMNPKIYKSYIKSYSAPAIYAAGNNAYISVHDSDIIQLSSQPAVHAGGNGIIASWIAATIYDGKNRISGGRLLASGSGVALFGELNGSKAQNHFCDGGSAVLEVNSSGTIFAAYNYWPNGLAPTQINNGGTIHYSNNLGSSECDVPFLTMTPDLFSNSKSGLNTSELKHQVSELYDILFDEILDNINKNDIANTIEKLLAIVSDDIMPISLTAFQIAVYLKKTGNIPVDNYTISLIAAETKHDDIRINAEYLLAYTELMDGLIDEALIRYERLSEEFNGKGVAFYAKLNRLYVYLEAGRINEAKNIYSELKQYDYPYDWVQHAALNLLDSQRNYVITEYSNKNEQETADAGISALVYPNPFNPNTTIRYTIPADNPVKIQIVDILGREVYQRVEHNRQAGSHEVVFEASHLASGLYFYMISSGSLHKTGSILLLK